MTICTVFKKLSNMCIIGNEPFFRTFNWVIVSLLMRYAYVLGKRHTFCKYFSQSKVYFFIFLTLSLKIKISVI